MNESIREQIIKELIAIRCNEAFALHEDHFYNKISKKHSVPIPYKEIYRIMPPRRCWKTLNAYKRRCMSPTQVNAKRLYYTIKDENISGRWRIELNEFINRVIKKFITGNISKPKIVFLPKDKETFRPLSLYKLEDRVYINLLARQITDKIDCHFQDTATAFRSSAYRKRTGIKNHHLAASKVWNYIQRRANTPLHCLEVDIKGFYDNVEKPLALELLAKITQQDDVRLVKKILDTYSYQECFSSAVKCKKPIKKHSVMHTNKGIPQGGAISCLLANVYLNDLDIAAQKYSKAFYIRYCDDIIFISPDPADTEAFFNDYVSIMNQLQLEHHPLKRITEYNKDFYASKSKAYTFSQKIPWISFLGYEYSFNGRIRIRKPSLTKEKENIKTFFGKIKELLIAENSRFDYKDFQRNKLRSIICKYQKRITGYNRGKNNHRAFSWSQGFQLINGKPIVKGQFKQLDKLLAKSFNDIKLYPDPIYIDKEANYYNNIAN